jgi:Mrp family chromosome partitioning ATPase
VVQHNKADKKLVKRSLAALRRVTPNLMGAVLNAVDVKAKGYYYYYHYRSQEPVAELRPSLPKQAAASKS